MNWCESCHTVLANEQVVEGCCWRCDNEVIQKQMPGYYIAITKYAQELLDDLDKLEGGWPAKVLTMQRNWIGRSEGLEFDFELTQSTKERLNHKFNNYSVFTTRADTIFGISYSALAPEHPIVQYMIDNKLLSDEKITTIKNMQKISQKDRALAPKEGVDLEIFVTHPLTKQDIPVGSKFHLNKLWWRGSYGSSCTR